MKWFKHETDAKDSEKLKDVISEFGYEGYGWYWRIMEIVAFKMDETGRCHYEQTVSEWCLNLKVKQKKLRLFLELIQNQFNIKPVYSEKKLRIEIPNLLKKRDDYTKRSEHKSYKLPKKFPLEVDRDKDREKDKTQTPNPRVSWFEKDWETYPRKEGNKKNAESYYLRSITTPEKRKAFLQKMDDYVKSIDDPIYLKHGETFFKNWENLETYKLPKNKEILSNMEQAQLSRGEFVDKVLEAIEIIRKEPSQHQTKELAAKSLIDSTPEEDKKAVSLILYNYSYTENKP